MRSYIGGSYLFAVCLVATISLAAAQRPQPAPVPPPPFSLTLSTPQDTVRIGSHIVIKVTLRNESARDYPEVWRSVAGQSNRVDVQRLDGGVVTETRRGAIRKGRIDITQMTEQELSGRSYLVNLKAGGTLEEFVDVSELYSFDQPGRYRIQVRTGVPPSGKESVQSNSIVVTVTP